MNTWLTEKRAFESLFSSSPDGIVAIDEHGRVLAANPSFTHLVGYAQDELLGSDLRELCGASVCAFFDEALIAGSQGRTLSHDADCRHKDGTIVPLQLTSVPVGPDAQPARIFLIAQDIMPRREAEQRLRSLFDRNPSIVIALDDRERITDVNPAGLRVSGFERSEIVGKALTDAIPPTQRDKTRGYYTRALGGETVSFELETYSANGQLLQYEAVAFPMVSRNRVIGVYALLDNVTERVRAERTVAAQREELIDLENDFHSLFEHNPNAVLSVTTSGVICGVNDAYVRLTGRAREKVIGKNFKSFLPVEERGRAGGIFKGAVEGEPVTFEVRSERAGGGLLELEVTLVPKYVQSQVVGIYAILQDRTEHNAAQHKLEAQAQRMRDLYVLATTAEYTDTHLMATLQMGCRLLGVESGAIVDTSNGLAVDMRYDAEDEAADDGNLLELAQIVEKRPEPVPSDPTGLWIGTRLTVGGAAQGTPHGILLFYSQHPRDHAFEEIDRESLALMAALIGTALERRRTRTQLRALAYYDSLTGLPNRLFLHERLRDALLDMRGHTRPVALLFFDLDRFKDLNDTLGHAMGDRFLQLVADRLVRNLGGNALVARTGGDEFIVLMRNCKSPQEVRSVAESLLRAVDEPYRIDRYEQFITASIGVAIYPQDGRDDQSLIKNADIAMYHAKSRGGNTYVCFDETLETPIRNRLTQEKQLRRALMQEQFVLHFQPIIDVRSGEVVSVEALVRWNHPQRGLIYPDEFIPVAEASGLIVGLGEWVIATAARHVRDWSRSIGPMSFAVNLSARQFHQADLCDRIAALIETIGIDPALVELEITETMTLANATHAIDTVRGLKRLGARIAVDDFGTGHSSLNYLRRFDVDYIKIDRSFVSGIGTQASDEAIVKAIVAMGHSLGLEVIAEGVETAAQYDFLRTHGCDRVQGYLFSRPIDAGALEELLREGRGTLLRPG